LDLEFRYLRDFLAVIESGSLGDAARRLKTSQPTLTRSVKLLEKSVGGAVFDRTPHGMRPTALGRALERRARIIVGEIDSARRELDDLVAARRGKVVVGAGPVFGGMILPRAVARFQAKHPTIDVAIVQGQMRETLPGVRTGEIDCAFHSAPDDLAREDLAHRVLLRGQVPLIVARRDHPLAAKKRVTLKEVLEQPWMLPRQPDVLRSRFEAAFMRAGLEPPRPMIEYTSVMSVPRFLLANRQLVTFLLDTMIWPELKNRSLVRLPVPAFGWTVDSSVIFRRGVALPPAAERLVEEVRLACAEALRR
jgi:LysR family transcriptional regulator of abg operon